MKLGLLFTFEVSLKVWDESGLMDRELALYRKLAGQGVKTTLFTYGDATESLYGDKLGDRIDVVPFFANGPAEKWQRFFASWIAPIRYKKRINRCGVIKTNQMWGSWVGLICKLILRKKWVLRCGFEHHRFLSLQAASLRDRVFSRVMSWLAYRLADAVIWSNDADRRWAARKFGLRLDDPRFHVIVNYVDTDLFTPDSGKERAGRILTVARLDRQKNLDTLIRALEGSGYELEVVGKGPLQEELEELAQKLGVKVIFRGTQSQRQVHARFSESQVFTLCSLYEGMPKALLEAMSCGLAVVGTDVEGIRDILEHNVNGLLCSPNAEDIRRALDSLIKDGDLRERLGTQARKDILAKYSLEQVANQEYSILKRLVD